MPSTKTDDSFHHNLELVKWQPEVSQGRGGSDVLYISNDQSFQILTSGTVLCSWRGHPRIGESVYMDKETPDKRQALSGRLVCCVLMMYKS